MNEHNLTLAFFKIVKSTSIETLTLVIVSRQIGLADVEVMITI